MIVTQHNIDLTQGADAFVLFQLEDEDGNLLDLSSYSARLQIRMSSYSSKFLDDLSTENGRITFEENPVDERTMEDGTKPKCIIQLLWSNTDTAKLPVGKQVYDLEIISSGGYITKLVRGNVNVNKDITR